MENPAPLTCALPERVATVGEGVKDSLPIVISYLPVAFAFGLNATRLGFTPLESLFFSCIIYAGASQFVITAMLAAGSSLWVAALTVMAMDVRHVLYGPSLRSRIRSALDMAVVLMTLQTLRNRETKTEQRRIDGVGLALLIIGIGSLQVMLDRGKELDWFSSNEIIILTIVAVVAISFLIVWELTDDNPIVDLSLFKSRNFTIGCLCISLAYMLYFGAIVLLPQLLQEVYGYTATWAGLASAPVGVIPVILSPIIGRFAHKLDMRRLVTFSFIMYAVCFYWRAWTFEPGMDFGASAWPQFIQGFAVACFFMPLTTITLSGLPPERLAAASSLSNFTRTLAGSIGTSITTTLWTNREALHHAQLTESVTPFNPNAQQIYDQLQGMGMTQQQASGWIAQQITNQGLIISANEIFWISAAIFILLLGLVWFARPPFSAGGGGGGAH